MAEGVVETMTELYNSPALNSEFMEENLEDKEEYLADLVTVDIKEEFAADDEDGSKDDLIIQKDRGKKGSDSIAKTVFFQCTQCQYSSTRLGNLKQHIESQHVGIRYQCDYCDYAATSAGHLKRHIESLHEGKRFPCDKCDYSATAARNLRRHMKEKHERIRYYCSECDFVATRSYYLKKHSETKHSVVIK